MHGKFSEVKFVVPEICMHKLYMFHFFLHHPVYLQIDITIVRISRLLLLQDSCDGKDDLW